MFNHCCVNAKQIFTLYIHCNVTHLKLEEEINQKKAFASQTAKVIVNLMYTGAWVANSLSAQLKPHGVTLKQFNILRILKGTVSPLTTSEIRDRMIDNMSDVTRLIDRLITKGYANRKKRSTDKRLVDITISHNGSKLLDKIDSDLPLYDFAKSLEDDETDLLNSLLDKLRNK